MSTIYDIKVSKTTHSKLPEFSWDNLVFGKYFTDHMLVADYENGHWSKVEIMPYQDLPFSPAMAALHYGQAIFEGIKAYKNEAGKAFIFRPKDNFKRFNISAARLEMPAVPEEIFIEGMRKLVDLDINWIPFKPEHALYIRPFMFATDPMLGVKPSETYKFIILLSPTGPYYPAPMRIYVEEKYTRAAPGGVGFAKAAGNYAASLLPATEARQKGYDQVLWTDAFEHKIVQEIGTMNVFFVVGEKVWTPALVSETILAGITRNTAITLFKEMGYEVEERQISIDELIEAYKAGQLKEAFGAGTAATISMIKELTYKDFVMSFDTDSWKVCTAMKARLDDIRAGILPDTHGWMFQVNN